MEQIHQTKDQPRIETKIDMKNHENADNSISVEHFKGELSKIDVRA